jgi:hypothetical protein
VINDNNYDSLINGSAGPTTQGAHCRRQEDGSLQDLAPKVLA